MTKRVQPFNKIYIPINIKILSFCTNGVQNWGNISELVNSEPELSILNLIMTRRAQTFIKKYKNTYRHGNVFLKLLL